MMIYNGLKIRWEKSREGSSPSARTNCLLVRLLTYGDQEWSASIAQGKAVAAALYSIPLPLAGMDGTSDRQ